MGEEQMARVDWTCLAMYYYKTSLYIKHARYGKMMNQTNLTHNIYYTHYSPKHELFLINSYIVCCCSLDITPNAKTPLEYVDFLFVNSPVPNTTSKVKIK